MSDDAADTGQKTTQCQAHQKAQANQLPGLRDEGLRDQQEGCDRQCTDDDACVADTVCQTAKPGGRQDAAECRDSHYHAGNQRHFGLVVHQLHDIDCDDRFDRHICEHQQHACREHGDDRFAIWNGGPDRFLFLFLAALGWFPFLTDQKCSGQEGEKNHAARQPESRTNTDQWR